MKKFKPLRRMDGRESKVSVTVTPPKPDYLLCPNCGYLSPAGLKVCTRCIHPLPAT